MISLHESKQPLLDIFINGKRQRVYFHQKLEEEKKNVVESVRPFLLDSDFREQYDLSLKQIDLLEKAIESDRIPEDDPKLRTKFFKVRRALKKKILTEMFLEGSDRFEINLPESKKEFAAHMQITGGTGAGKTFWTREFL